MQGMKLAVAATAVSASALLGLGAGEAGAATTCTWGGTPTAPTGVFTITPGVTNVPSQVEMATTLNALENLQNQIDIFAGDYTALPIDDDWADGVWAIESACYARGSTRETLAREMHRVLKTCGRFAIADCFIKNPEKKLNPLIGK